MKADLPLRRQPLRRTRPRASGPRKTKPGRQKAGRRFVRCTLCLQIRPVKKSPPPGTRCRCGGPLRPISEKRVRDLTEPPVILYQAPDDWAPFEQLWLTEEQLRRSVEGLKRAGVEACASQARRWVLVQREGLGRGVYEDCGDPALPEHGWTCPPYEHIVQLRYSPQQDAWVLVRVLGVRDTT
jgi:hypothetical protein